MYDLIAFMWLFSIVALILGFMYLVIRLTDRGKRNGEP
jgi:flagellar biogenesis protein FliO